MMSWRCFLGDANDIIVSRCILEYNIYSDRRRADNSDWLPVGMIYTQTSTRKYRQAVVFLVSHCIEPKITLNMLPWTEIHASLHPYT